MPILILVLSLWSLISWAQPSLNIEDMINEKWLQSLQEQDPMDNHPTPLLTHAISTVCGPIDPLEPCMRIIARQNITDEEIERFELSILSDPTLINKSWLHPKNHLTTLLLEAIVQHQPSLVQLLLHQGADPFLKDGFIASPFLIAMRSKNQQIFEYMLEAIQHRYTCLDDLAKQWMLSIMGDELLRIKHKLRYYSEADSDQVHQHMVLLIDALKGYFKPEDLLRVLMHHKTTGDQVSLLTYSFNFNRIELCRRLVLAILYVAGAQISTQPWFNQSIEKLSQEDLSHIPITYIELILNYLNQSSILTHDVKNHEGGRTWFAQKLKSLAGKLEALRARPLSTVSPLLPVAQPLSIVSGPDIMQLAAYFMRQLYRIDEIDRQDFGRSFVAACQQHPTLYRYICTQLIYLRDDEGSQQAGEALNMLAYGLGRWLLNGTDELMQAVVAGHLPEIQGLIRQGYSPYQTNHNGLTAIDLAIVHPRIIQGFLRL